MMMKLLKYDLKSMAKVIVPFWIALFTIGILCSAQIKFGLQNMGGAGNTLLVISFMVFIALIVAVMVMNFAVIIQRFWKGLLKEEGYLMFTLPVSERNLILSKGISAMLITMGTFVVIVLLVLAVGLMHGLELRQLAQIRIPDWFTAKWGFYMIAFCVINILSGIYHLYVAMAIGQLSNKNRFLCSFAAYIVLAIVFTIVETLVLEGSSTRVYDMVSEWVYLAVGAAEVIIYHIITEYILSKKLNLE
ncbi:MAG TPA: hypothetical protein H9735_02035 [Candidatus Anaerostipes excrementavium]|uniref:Uncharacterized protein n=1 Tax=Candidatus Anaerostipes excrementavium TaxID=2838463 RepID=A0A9D1WTJ2_9FIRM|nr:hypothetical protein [uncultured Anaerostipes sp.]HIX66889.1 hypothetical protein [Candidatus Anaerostipes excrementavium]